MGLSRANILKLIGEDRSMAPASDDSGRFKIEENRSALRVLVGCDREGAPDIASGSSRRSRRGANTRSFPVDVQASDFLDGCVC
jgi:hypothetical protein